MSYKMMAKSMRKASMNAPLMGAFSGYGEESDELTPDEKLRLLVYQPFIELEIQVQDVLSTNTFARDNVTDKEFASVVCKKIVKDLRAAADKFEAATVNKKE